MTATAGDHIRASVSVAVPQDRAFDLFTREIDRWWRRGPRFRGGAGLLHMEPHVGGRLFESWTDSGQERVHEAGRIVQWHPPHALAFTWRAGNFAPHEQTLVEVTFQPAGPATLVTVTHSGWAAIPPDHPVRHGEPAVTFQRRQGHWWADQLTALRHHAG